MKTFIKHLSILATCACAGMTITSCTADKDYFDPNAIAQQAKADYESTFISQFGTISPTQSWDFTKKHSTRATRATNNSLMANWGSEWRDIDQSILNNISKIMIEGVKNKVNNKNWDNTNQGESFTWVMPDNGFNITPIFQGGNSCSNVKLYMVVKEPGKPEVEYLIWEKGNNLRIKESRYNKNWTNINDGDSDRKTYGTTKIDSYSLKKINDELGNKYVADLVYAVQAQTLHIEDGTFAPGSRITFKSTATYNRENYTHYSYDTPNQAAEMITLDADRIGQIPSGMVAEGNQYKILACEAGADHDCNDVVFLVEGLHKVPDTSVITETGVRENPVYTEKRYMVEDLGAAQASDVDFNDVVMDLKQTVNEYYQTTTTTRNDEVVELTEELIADRTTTSQKLIIRALGGTKNIQVLVGGKLVFEKANYDGIDYHVMYNTGAGPNIDPIEIDLAQYGNPWIPDENNVQVIVGGPSEPVQVPDDIKLEINFPKDGTVPAVIAVKPYINWNAERVSVFQEGSNVSLKQMITK